MPHPPDGGVQGDPRPELDGTAGLSGPGGVAPPDPPLPSLAGTPKAPLRSGERASGALTAGSDPRLTNRMTHTDAATVALARDGNSEAFRALVEHHSRAVYRLAHRMTGNPSDAEDVVQETFLRAYKQLGRFESRANFGTWLHRIAVNCSIDLIRARPRRETSHDVADLEVMNAPPVTSKAVEASPERLMLSAEVQERISSCDDVVEPDGTRRIRLAAFRGPFDRRDQPDPRAESERGEALDLSRGEENAGGPRAIRADGIGWRLCVNAESPHARTRRRSRSSLLR